MVAKKDILSADETHDMNQLIKLISDSIKAFYDGTNVKELYNKDVSLMAMQVLSLLCGINRGYTKSQMDTMWEKSRSISRYMNDSRRSDKVDGMQKFNGSKRVALKN